MRRDIGGVPGVGIQKTAFCTVAAPGAVQKHHLHLRFFLVEHIADIADIDIVPPYWFGEFLQVTICFPGSRTAQQIQFAAQRDSSEKEKYQVTELGIEKSDQH